ncbi:transcription factor Pcc1-domain-containing protein [Sphaerosporella brunnea]|uniref:Transcription factor Pcc1-domain-containing protein n=1 Tax=Sphaerosporella brunnea TaxID=1250544 RepID=A0A5J5EIG1_9PEZI|nr:transcription factor Pcc1-domain-containing protein [Sphaerosporella brunnea]
MANANPIATTRADPAFPHSLTISVPLPTPRLATTLMRSLAVDQELSPLVHRDFHAHGSTLVVSYKATTARMLRVATNGVFESLGTLLRLVEELDVGVMSEEGL